MIPSCPKCVESEIFDREIPGAYKNYQKLFRIGVGLILISLTSIVLLAVEKLALVLILIPAVGAAVFIVKASNIKVAEMYCKKCDWQKKR